MAWVLLALEVALTPNPQIRMTCTALQLRPSMGARIDGWQSKASIREESENDAFHFPRSKKPLTDFLRQYQYPNPLS